jgi:hypothetical protein
MRLTPILLQEGRKEDLRKKYTEKFKDYPETLDFILSIADLADTNFKYGDFVLKNTHPNASPEEVEHIIDLVKDFDRFQQALEVKDINKYNLHQLSTALDKHKDTSKSQQKKSFDTSGAKKIFEDKNILIVRPLTFEASCKYGSGTRWCTTMAGQSSYFENHTSKDQALYYIILKNFNRDNKFYKIAIHKTPNTETWYDSSDTRMSEREQEVFSLAAPKVIDTVRNDYSQHIKERGELFFKKLFDFHNYKFENVSSAFKGTENKIGLEFQKPDLVPDMPGHATMELNISVDEENVDQYLVMITYDIGSKVRFTIGYSANDEIEPEFDFDIENVSTHFQIPVESLSNTTREYTKSIFDELCWTISKQIVYKMLTNNQFMSSVNGGNVVWRPNRLNYGFTFKQNKGMIKKLVDYLDAENVGTKLDFLVNAGILERKEVNGKPLYSHTGKKDWRVPSTFRGQHSGFFNSARLAGIVDYDKKGNQFYLKKGPNFEAFKSGKLSPL